MQNSGLISAPGMAKEPERLVYTFGQNSYGELAHGDTVRYFLLPVLCCALCQLLTTFCTEQAELLVPTIVEFARDKNVVQIAAGNEHTAILCENGDLVSARMAHRGSIPNERTCLLQYSCGYNDSGQCGVVFAGIYGGEWGLVW